MHNIMDKYKILSDYKYKIINAFDYEDALSLLDISLSLTNDDIEKGLLNSLVMKHRYCAKMTLDKLTIYTNVLGLVYYYDDAEKIVQDIETNINDIAQLNTFKRIIKYKPHKQLQEKDSITVVKYCPHCNKKYYGFANSPYVICGYGPKGYDWKGCGRDWCLKCGKKLCKNWNHDLLFNKLNRYHDSKCCKSYASTFEFNYPDDFCNCVMEFVNRDR